VTCASVPECPPNYGTTRDADQSTNRPTMKPLNITVRSPGFPAESRRITRTSQMSSPRRPTPTAKAMTQAMTEASVWSTPKP
jgi:hypothetical protein